MKHNVLILGSGGREHALAWAIEQSPLAGEVYVLPGNGGTHSPEAWQQLDICDATEVARCVQALSIQLVVVGPEAPLAAGIVDRLSEKGIPAIGPGETAAMLESSKAFAKAFMKRYDIPTARYRDFGPADLVEALAFVDELGGQAVVKADGLAAGKGVVVCTEASAAKQAIREMLVDGRFAQAGARIVVEQLLPGIEMSVFVLTDGKNALLLPSAKDYKRIGEGDTGANTGGMGAISPVPFADATLMQKIQQQVVNPTIKGIALEGWPYTGFVFIGLMIVNDEPYVLEYNVRMGDPETQSVMSRLDGDLLAALLACHSGQLKTVQLKHTADTAVTVVLASQGYPESYPKGKAISKLSPLPEGVRVFHAGTKMEEGQLVTAGGRVLAVTATAKKPEDARRLAQQAAQQIHFEGKYFRRDIGRDVLAD